MNGKAVTFHDIVVGDGSSRTFMLVEAGEAVPWSKPADVVFDAKKPLPKLGGIFDGDFNVAFCDGSVRYVKKGVKEEILKMYITIDGGEEPGENALELWPWSHLHSLSSFFAWPTPYSYRYAPR